MDEKGSVNLCNIYVLPLLGLNKWSFGTAGQFVNSYVSDDDHYIVVECKGMFNTIITRHPNFKFQFENIGLHTAVFDVPRFYLEDVKKFRVGKYSQLSETAKTQIRSKSGLTYKVPKRTGGYESAIELLALDKDKELKSHLEKVLDVKLDDTAELASIPDETNFYKLNVSKSLESTTY